MSEKDTPSSHGIEYTLSRLENALNLQENKEGKIAKKPTVAYCFECDEIAVDSWVPDGCVDHRTVSSDGYEHGGIRSAIIALRSVKSGEARSGGDE